MCMWSEGVASITETREAQRGAQILLDLFCGRQGEFQQRHWAERPECLLRRVFFCSIPTETLQEKTIKSFHGTFQQQYHSLLEQAKFQVWPI